MTETLVMMMMRLLNMTAALIDEEGTETDVSELDRGSTFLLGTTTQFGCQVRINSRLIFMTGVSLTSVKLLNVHRCSHL